MLVLLVGYIGGLIIILLIGILIFYRHFRTKVRSESSDDFNKDSVVFYFGAILFWPVTILVLWIMGAFELLRIAIQSIRLFLENGASK